MIIRYRHRNLEKKNPAYRLYRRLGFECIEDKGVYDLLEWSRKAEVQATSAIAVQESGESAGESSSAF